MSCPFYQTVISSVAGVPSREIKQQTVSQILPQTDTLHRPLDHFEGDIDSFVTIEYRLRNDGFDSYSLSRIDPKYYM